MAPEPESLFPTPPPSAPPRPLADRMRPRTLDELAGQEELAGPGTPLRNLIESGNLPSLIFWGPPGSGKTTLARLGASAAEAAMVEVSAVESGVKELRAAVERAREEWRTKKRRTVLFIDEVHRFSKVQQDAILPHVEEGRVIVIGSTTENPAFEVIPALRSRCRIFRFALLPFDAVRGLLDRAAGDADRGIAGRGPFDPAVLDRIATLSGGDARTALNLLEGVAHAAAPGEGTVELVDRLAKDGAIYYDKQGQEHYDHASAFQKSLRGSDPDAAIYWLAKMIAGGEDPRFIARRLMVCASEDVGLADPAALMVAVAAAEAVERVGMPEGRIPLAHATLHIATAPKSNAAYLAIKKALDDVAAEGVSLPVPDHLKDTSYKDARKYGFGKGYQYPHDFPGHWVDQQYLPDGLAGRRYYTPSGQGRETPVADRPRGQGGTRKPGE